MGRPLLYDLMGKIFGELTVIGREQPHEGRGRWIASCSCGTTVRVSSGSLRSGRTRSCGHIRIGVCRKRVGENNPCYKPDAKYRTVEYYVWTAMKQRCLNPKSVGYENYGGRGITVCEPWMSFDNFLADMGKRPSPELSIDRIDNNGNYEPGNCRWATAEEQRQNKRRQGRPIGS